MDSDSVGAPHGAKDSPHVGDVSASVVPESGAVELTHLQKLQALFDWLIEDGFCEIDGGDLQNKAEELGLIRIVPYDPVAHGNGAADDYGMEPGEAYYEVIRPRAKATASPQETTARASDASPSVTGA